jgi:hypothetical protein
MQRGRNKDAAAESNQGDAHEFVIADIRGEDGFYVRREATCLTDVRHSLESAGKRSEFKSYCVFEELLRNRHLQQLADLDADDSFADDVNESGEYNRG